MHRKLSVIVYLLVAALAVTAQDVMEPRLQVSGACSFFADIPNAELRIPFFALDANGNAPEIPTVTVTDQVSGTEITPVNPIIQRDPRQALQILFLVDVTGSVQLDALNNIWTSVLRDYNSEDRFALMSFSDADSLGGIDPLLLGDAFGLVDDISDLERNNDPAQGIAVLYEALRLAVQRSANERDRSNVGPPVVVVVTDSSNTEGSGIRADDVISVAQDAGVRIFAVGYRTADNPDPELPRIAAATHGYAWMPDEGDTADTIAERASERMTAFREALNGEYLLTLGLSEVTLDENGSAQIGLALAGQEPMVVECAELRLPEPTATPDLVNTLQVEGINDPDEFDPDSLPTITVQIDTPGFQGAPIVTARLNEQEFPLDVADQTSVVFDLSSEASRAALSLGRNMLIVSVRDSGNETADPLLLEDYIFTIPDSAITLSLDVEGATAADDLIGDVTFVASVPAEAGALLAAAGSNRVVFELLPTRDGAEQLEPVTLDSATNTAQLIVAAIDSLPEADQITEVQAYLVDADGNPLDDSISTRASLPIGVTIETLDLVFLVATLGASIVLLLIDLFLLRQIRITRIRRLIEGEDAHPLPTSPMVVTVKVDYRSDTYNLLKRTMSVGRGSSNDINLPDDTGVSREHGVLVWRRRKWYFTHRNRRSTSTIDKRNIRGFRLVEVKPSTQIRVRNFILTFHRENEDPDDLTKTQF